MELKKIILSTALVAMVFCSFNKEAYSTSEPSFPSCLNPQGTLKVKYDNGTHGIVGDGVHTGRDEVYAISDNSLIQCFCPENGNGIQTNWWKTENFTIDEIKSYQDKGWILVPDGSVWGLENIQYLAINLNYSCASSNGGGSSQIGIGQVLALASTGNIVFIYTVALVGISLIAVGIFKLLWRKSS